MKSFSIFYILFFGSAFLYAQDVFIKGEISTYENQSLTLYACYGDTLLFKDSTRTNKKGEFVFFFTENKENSKLGIYKVVLKKNQFFYVLNDGSPIKIKTNYIHNPFNNYTSDNVEVIQSEENKLFYEFQQMQKQITIANYMMREMLLKYPIEDPFHKVIEKEYSQRYEAMELFFKEANKQNKNNLATKVINAYEPINPDWKKADNWRDSIRAAHYFDNFNPADEFYLRTNILPEKILNYFDLFSFLMHVNRETRFDYEQKIKIAANEFLKHTSSNSVTHNFCLQYILKKLDDDKMYDAMISVYDTWVNQAITEDCEQANPELNKWRAKVSALRNVLIGGKSPDFELIKGGTSMHQIQADFTLIVFWSTWCPHCVEEIPKTKKALENFQRQHPDKSIKAVYVSLDNQEKPWKEFIEKNGLSNDINFCDFKSWKGDVVKQYNVFATPTVFLLDKSKTIIAKPETSAELIKILSK